jgi:hypothetical protein
MANGQLLRLHTEYWTREGIALGSRRSEDTDSRRVINEDRSDHSVSSAGSQSNRHVLASLPSVVASQSDKIIRRTSRTDRMGCININVILQTWFRSLNV